MSRFFPEKSSRRGCFWGFFRYFMDGARREKAGFFLPSLGGAPLSSPLARDFLRGLPCDPRLFSFLPPPFMPFSSLFSPRVHRTFGAGKRAPKRTETKAEAAALAWLTAEGWQTIPQPCRLFPLEGGGSYTPDLLAWRCGFPGVLVVEVKGGYRGAGWEQGYERYKRAAASCDCPAWRFCLAEVKKGGTIEVAFWSAGADVLALGVEVPKA